MSAIDPTLRLAFLEGMSRAATFVAVATTDGVGGRAGVTISSLTSVSADGEWPSLLACIHHQSPAATAILHNQVFCANLLHEGQQALSDLFAGRAGAGPAERFERLAWTPGRLGQPLIDGAAARFECRVGSAMRWDTHHIIVGQVVAVSLCEAPGALLYGARAYRRAVQLVAERA